MTVKRALRRYQEAKKNVRTAKRHGTRLPHQPSLRDRFEAEMEAIRLIARRSKYAEPWASYLAPYQYDLQQAWP